MQPPPTLESLRSVTNVHWDFANLSFAMMCSRRPPFSIGSVRFGLELGSYTHVPTEREIAQHPDQERERGSGSEAETPTGNEKGRVFI